MCTLISALPDTFKAKFYQCNFSILNVIINVRKCTFTMDKYICNHPVVNHSKTLKK